MSPPLRLVFLLLALSNAFGFAIGTALWPGKSWNPLRDITLGLPATSAALMLALVIELWR